MIFWNTDLKNLRNLKNLFITKGTKGFGWMLMVCFFWNADETDFLSQKAQKGVGEIVIVIAIEIVIEIVIEIDSS